MLNSFQRWAINAAWDRGFRARPVGNWLEVFVGGDWVAVMSVAGVLSVTGEAV